MLGTELLGFHVGNLIISFLKKSNIPQAHLARELSMATSNVNRLLKRDSMETNLILEISKKLNHNFFADISGDVQEGKPYSLIHPQIGKRIEERLKELNMTQSQFATLLNVTPAEVSRLIRKESFDAQKLLKISRILDYDFFQDFYQYTNAQEESKADGWTSLLKRNEELAVENAQYREFLQNSLAVLGKWKDEKGFSPETMSEEQFEQLSSSDKILFLWYTQLREQLPVQEKKGQMLQSLLKWGEMLAKVKKNEED